MDEAEILNIRQTISNYYNKKAYIKKQIQDYCAGMHTNDWRIEEFKNELYKELTDSIERGKFTKLSERASKDEEFEYYFRSLFLEVFCNIFVSPEDLKKNTVLFK